MCVIAYADHVHTYLSLYTDDLIDLYVLCVVQLHAVALSLLLFFYFFRNTQLSVCVVHCAALY